MRDEEISSDERVNRSRLGVGNRQPANFKALYPNATDEGIDLLRQLLVLEPEERISAQAALRHPFVQEFLIEVNDNGDLLMEEETGKFDFGFESEVSEAISFSSLDRRMTLAF